MALSSTSPQTPRTSKTLLISWLSTFKAKRQAAMMSTISLSLMVWEMQFGTSSQKFMRPNGMPYLLIRNRIISGPRFHLNSPHVLLLTMVIPRRTYPSRPPSLSIKPCLSPLFQPNPRRRLTLSPSISSPRNLQTITATDPPMFKLANHMLRPLRLRPTYQKS